MHAVPHACLLIPPPRSRRRPTASSSSASPAIRSAWEAIVRQNWRKVFNVAYKFVGKHDEAEDLTQDIFLKIFKALKTFDRRANFQTWIISISRNLCIDHYRSVRKERQTIAREVDTNDLQPASTRADAVRGRRAPGPARAAAAGAGDAAGHAADGRRAARSAGAVVSGDRRSARAARRHGEVAHQPRPARAGPPAEAAAGQTAGAAPQARRARAAAEPAIRSAPNESHNRTRQRHRGRQRRRIPPDVPAAVGVLHRRARSSSPPASARSSSICRRSATSTARPSAA